MIVPTRRLLVLCTAVTVLMLAPVQAGAASKRQGRAEAGRTIFNGKGTCYYCHGEDGRRDRLPALRKDTADLIARLNPPPADLRNAGSLKRGDDTMRAQLIREGHPGTGMFPDTTVTDDELLDLLAYLAALRSHPFSE